MSSSWLKSCIIYQIFIDRFAGYDTQKDASLPQFVGGNLRGIIEKLPYLKHLGIDCIWISPFYACSSYHGYDITDYFSVDEHFGTESDLQELIMTAHQYDIRIIADFVPNHCSCEHPFFIDALEHADSPYRNWFFFNKDGSYACFLDYEGMPKFNLDFSPAKDYIIRAAKKWLSLGLDGFRLDHAVGPSLRFWKHFCHSIKQDFSHAVLIGEILLPTKFKFYKNIAVPHKLLHFLNGGAYDSAFSEYTSVFDGVLDYRFYELMEHYIAKNKNPNSLLLKFSLWWHRAGFPKKFSLVSFLSNHDINRFLFLCKGDLRLFHQALLFQFRQREPLIIYYGEEIGMIQNRNMFDFKSHGDLQVRQPMEWNKESELLFLYQKFIQKRKEFDNV